MSEASNQELNLNLPAKIRPVFQGSDRYQILYGGRGSGKTVSIAQILLTEGYVQKHRILCTREIQKTIRESVHQVLCDEIDRLGLEDFYSIKHDTIIGKNGTEFIFAGLRQMDVSKLKSLHGVTIAWCEEAHVISDRSWDVLIPTIRAEGSRIILTFNPELDTDPTYMRFIENTPPNSYLAKVNYSDNPWFPEVLEEERAYLELTDKTPGKVKYKWIWEGQTMPAVEGAIFANEVAQLHEDGRVRPLDYDPKGRVYGVMDLGWGVMTLALAQRFASTVQVIKYYEVMHTTYAQLTAQVREDCKGFRWGKIFMPHDASHRDPKYGKSHFDVMRELEWEVEQVPQIGVENYIEAGRQLFGNMYLSDGEDIKRLIHCCRRYRRQLPTTTDHPGSPLKDEFSHGAETLCYLAVIAEKMVNDDRVMKDPYRGFEDQAQGMPYG